MKTIKLNISKIFNWTVWVYLVLIFILTFKGRIYFGYGLGDVFYFLMIGLIAFVHLIFNLVIGIRRFKKDKRQIYWATGIFFGIVAVIFTILFTVGRGPEYRWNGDILVTK